MNDIDIAESDPIESSKGFDRRSALRKAAVAGTVVWAAPTLLYSTALAGNFCTPKCYPIEVGPTSFSPNCHTSVDSHFFTVTVGMVLPIPFADCPCDTGSPLYGPVIFTNWVLPTGFDIFSIVDDHNGSYTIRLFSAVQSEGDFSFDIAVTSLCLDRSGDVAEQTCDYRATFSIELEQVSDDEFECDVMNPTMISLDDCGPVQCLEPTNP